MNWDAVSAIAEIVGATAVVVTLIYLALQVRQGTKATQGVSIQAASTLDQDFLLAVSRDPATAETWAMYMTTPDKLSHEQKLQGAFLMASVVRRLENILLQMRLGTLSPEKLAIPGGFVHWYSALPRFRSLSGVSAGSSDARRFPRIYARAASW